MTFRRLRSWSSWFDQIARDATYAWRSLRRAPGFFIAAVSSLALGIGGTTVIYAVVDHIALRPLAYREPDRLAVVREILPDLVPQYASLPASAAAFLDWRRQCQGCEELAALAPRGFTLSVAGDPERVSALRVSANLLPMLGTSPVLGRWFSVEEDRPGSDRVAILSEALWRRRFGADSTVLGRAISLDGQSFAVVGVLPATFRAPKGSELGELMPLAKDLDLVVPLALTPTEIATPLNNNFAVLVRRRARVTTAQLAAEISTIEASRSASLKVRFLAVVTPLATQMIGSTQTALVLLLAAVGALLVLVCLNLGSLFTARCALRSRELALRAAVGASRVQLVRLAIVESLLLAAIGGVVGMLLSRWGLAALLRMAPGTIPRLDEVRLDWRVLVVGLGLAALVGMGFGAIPAIRASRVRPGDLLVSVSRVKGGRGATRAGALLIASQVGIGVLLLVTTGLLLNSFLQVLRVDKGFVPDRILTISVVTPESYASPERRALYYDQAMATLGALAGVERVGLTSTLPLSGEAEIAVGFGRENDPRPADHRPPLNVRYVSPSYFGVVGIPILHGRPFADADRGRKVTVLSRSAAVALWPGEDAVGKWLNDRQAEVVGVAADVRTNGLERDVSPIIYVPHWFFGSESGTIVIKTTGQPSLKSLIKTELRRVDPAIPSSRVGVLDGVVSTAVAERRFQLIVLGLFALTALVTATIGVYGVVAQWVSSRHGELGIRLAIGASPRGVQRLVLGQGLGPTAIGGILGLALALLVGRVIRSLLFGVQPTDLVVLIGATAVVASAAALACYVPTRRAVLIDPASSLRSE